jgi:PAS domain S-box-containing protein
MTLFFPRRSTQVQGILHALLGVLAITGGCRPAVAETGGNHSDFPATVRIGVLANRGSAQCLAMWGATADYLTAHVPGHRFEIVSLGYADAEPAITERQVDFIFVNSAQHVELENQYNVTCIATLKNKVDGETVSRYASVIFCRAGRQDIGCLNDLRGKSFMAPDEDSFGGWQMTLREFHQKGIDPDRDFSSIHFAGSQDAVVRAVLDGAADAGTVRSGVLEQMATAGKIRREDFQLVSAYDGPRHVEAPRLISTRSYPEWPMARLQHVPLALAEQVAEALRSMPADSPAARKAEIAGWTYPADYDEVRECLKELQLGPYRPRAVTPAALLKAYWPWLLAALLVAAGMAVTIAIFARMNGRLAVAQKAACTELAERRAAEQRLAAAADALHNRGEWLKTVVNASADGIIAIDEDGTITLFNHAAERIFGWKTGEMLGQPLDRLMPAEFRETHRQHLRSYFTTGRPNAAIGQALELTGLRNDGQPIPLELSIAASRSAEKKLVVAVFRDISERKRHEEELRQAKEHAEETAARIRILSRAVEQSPTSVVITDLEGSVKYVNPGFTQTTGYTPEEVIGKNPRVLQSGVHPREFYEQMWQTLTLGEVWRGEVCNRKKSGELYWEDATIAPVSDADGAVTHFVAVKVDVTQRKLADEALALAKEQAEEASRAKSQFLAAMSHELRTPLNGVIGMAELLGNTELDERQRGFVEACRSSGKSLLGLINDILDFSKIEAGKLELDEHDFDLGQLVEETVATMAFQARQKKIHVFGRVAPQSCRTVRGDSERLRQLLVNLIGNAIKFTAAGEVTVRVELAEAADDPWLVRFRVSDTGIGIPADRMQRLFQSFSQADTSTTRKYGGTGLGLAICKALVELMGGTIGVQSEPGHGSTFWFTVPLKGVAGKEGGLSTLSAELRRLRVLVLDGQAVTRQHLVDIFRAWAVPVDTAATPSESIEKLRSAAESRQPVDLLLVDDETLSKEQIGDFLGEVRRTPGLPTCRHFFLASPENGLAEEERRHLGIDRCLSKPVCQSALLGALNDYFVNLRSGRGPSGAGAAAQLAAMHDFSGARVLLAEDNHVNRVFAGELLRQAGVECRAVENGRQALEALAVERFDLVLMDCQMPEMDGFTASQRIREMEADGQLPGRLPVIALTANAIRGDRERCLAAGMDDYLSKPFEARALMAIMGRFLSGPRETVADAAPQAGRDEDCTAPDLTPEPDVTPAPELASGLDSLPPIDREALLSHCAESAEFARSLLSDFAVDLPMRLEQIVRHVGEGDATAVSEAAHSLKGSAGILAATAVRKVAAELEAAGKAGKLAEMTPLVNRLGEEIEHCLNYLPEIQCLLECETSAT